MVLGPGKPRVGQFLQARAPQWRLVWQISPHARVREQLMIPEEHGRLAERYLGRRRHEPFHAELQLGATPEIVGVRRDLEDGANVVKGIDPTQDADDGWVGHQGVDARLPATVTDLERGELLGLEGSQGG